MMAMRILLVTVFALAAGLTALWLGPDARPRPHGWEPPAPLLPEITIPSGPAGMDARAPSGVGAYFAILDRPVFAPDRRPPPPPDAKPVEPPPDPLAGLTLFGVFSGSDFSGIVARINDRVRRVRVGELLGDWTVQGVQGRSVTFVRGDETRTVQLAHAYGQRPVTAPGAVGGAPAAPAPSGRPDLASIQQQEQEAARERLRQRNELFRKAGLPPVKE